MLNLLNPNSINWTLVVSSTLDSASTQKRINKIIEEQRQCDEKMFSPATVETIDMIETFCSMHLGVNLRKAFLCGTDHVDEQRYHKELFLFQTFLSSNFLTAMIRIILIIKTALKCTYIGK